MTIATFIQTQGLIFTCQAVDIINIFLLVHAIHAILLAQRGHGVLGVLVTSAMIRCALHALALLIVAVLHALLEMLQDAQKVQIVLLALALIVFHVALDMF